MQNTRFCKKGGEGPLHKDRTHADLYQQDRQRDLRPPRPDRDGGDQRCALRCHRERPPEPQARAEYIERVASAEYAERYLGRAYERLLAAGEAAQPHLEKPFSVEYAEAANAADLLIAADLLMALMLKPPIPSGRAIVPSGW
jgi:hypothetical protein